MEIVVFPTPLFKFLMPAHNHAIQKGRGLMQSIITLCSSYGIMKIRHGGITATEVCN
jgi:hypothetical protein